MCRPPAVCSWTGRKHPQIGMEEARIMFPPSRERRAWACSRAQKMLARTVKIRMPPSPPCLGTFNWHLSAPQAALHDLASILDTCSSMNPGRWNPGQEAPRIKCTDKSGKKEKVYMSMDHTYIHMDHGYSIYTYDIYIVLCSTTTWYFRDIVLKLKNTHMSYWVKNNSF